VFVRSAAGCAQVAPGDRPQQEQRQDGHHEERDGRQQDPAPAALTTAATSAPIANGPRKKLSVSTSPTPKATATISQMTHASIGGEV
jgi:hypothetical protein